MNRLKYILQHRYYLKIVTILFLIIILIYTTTHQKESIYSEETSFSGIIYKIKVKNDITTIYLKNKESLIIKYQGITNYHLGDTIAVSGTLTKPSNNTVPNLFNYRKYLYYNHIYYIINANKITKIANNTSVIYHIKNIITNHIKKIPYNHEYINTFILGDNSFIDNDIINSYRNNGISHLFSISGMHISLFASFILLILKRISYNNYFNYGIVIIFLTLHIILIDIPTSALRSLIMYILFALNKVLNLKVNKINIMLIVLIIMLLINPYNLYLTSFQYSYLISFYLIIFSHKIKKYKSPLTKSLYISLITFLISFPINIYNNFEVNILSILLNIIFIPIVSLIIFPISIIAFIVPNISIIITPFLKLMEYISLFITKYHLFTIIFAKPNIIIIILYYILIYLFLINYKYYYIFILITINKFYPYLNNQFMYTTIDVDEGDSILITMPYNKENILIDTGGSHLNNYSYSTKRIIPYLKSIGITKLNSLILTHGDYDHMGEAINLVNNFKVEKVIFNCGEFNDLEQDLIKVLNKKKIPYYSCIKELNIDKNKLYFLQTKEYDNENDNSNVIYTEINGYKFMFMGDAELSKEKDILDKYNISNIDVLKVGHHGSKTSSGKFFINEMSPKYSIISVGKNNRYGHPNKEVLNVLDNSKIYRTDQDGSIMFKIKNNKLKIKTCSP